MRPIAALLLAALLQVASCGASTDPMDQIRAGERALGTQHSSAARTEFQGALASLGDGTEHPYYLRAKLGEIEARSAIHLGFGMHTESEIALATREAQQAKDDLIALAESMPGQVAASDFNRIACRLGDAGHLSEAIALQSHAETLFPDSEHLKKLGAELAAKAEKAADLRALRELLESGLVYYGYEDY